jgi:EAL and modified HD-GYP domain-containing signal transduction protein
VTGGEAPVVAPGELPQVHVGRQPIYDADLRLHAYELLFRSAQNATRAQVDATDAAGDQATTSTILAAFSGFGAADLLGGRPGFVNLTRAFLVGDLPVPFEPDQAVLEVLETVTLDPEVLDGVRRLKRAGYRIALDDFVWTKGADDVVDLASIVKLDVLTPWPQVIALADRCRSRGGNDLVLLAERVEDEQMLQRCLDHGFTLFQGYHLGRPQTLSSDTLSSDRLTVLQMLTRLSASDVQLRDIESIMRADPALVLQLLRLANSSVNGLTRTISTITDAAVLLGLTRLRAWVLLLSMSTLTGAAGDTSLALLRGYTCEQLARRTPSTSPSGGSRTASLEPETAFAAGLFDGIATLLGISSAALIESLPPLDAQLYAALTGRPGPLGELLAAVRAYDCGDQAAVRQTGYGVEDVADCYLTALSWTTRAMAPALQHMQ